MTTGLLLGGCRRSETPIAAYRRPIDAFAQLLPLSIFGVYPCTSVTRWHGQKVYDQIPVDQCYRMKPPQRMHGIWVDEFEGSRFFQNASDPKDVIAALKARTTWPFGEWLTTDRVRDQLPNRVGHSRLYAVDFVGRRTAYNGSYGHMGGSASLVIVDRLLSAKLLYASQNGYFENE